MITFQGRQDIIKSADIIERRAHSVYPHTSLSKLRKRCIDVYNIAEHSSKPAPLFFQKIFIRTNQLRSALRQSNSFFSDLIYGMQDKKVGNCFEEAALAQLIGKVNGQKNIYVGDILVEKENIEGKRKIDHAVAFITDKKIEIGKSYSFKNKDAIIIDPWLGIADFAENYFTKLKNNFCKFFKELPDQDFLLYLIGSDSKNIKEFRKGRKSSCQNVDFSIRLASNFPWNKKKQNLYESFFPELVIKEYKKIELPKTAKSKSIEK